MKCPHCLVAFYENREWFGMGKDKDGEWAILKTDCPTCGRMILNLVNGDAAWLGNRIHHFNNVTQIGLVRPKGVTERRAPKR